MKADGTTLYAAATKFSNGTDVILQCSPSTLSLPDVHFQAIVGHELWHVYHYYAIPDFLFDAIYSERAAYYYSAQVYFNNGDMENFMNVIQGAGQINQWGVFPDMYMVPKMYGFSN